MNQNGDDKRTIKTKVELVEKVRVGECQIIEGLNIQT